MLKTQNTIVQLDSFDDDDEKTIGQQQQPSSITTINNEENGKNEEPVFNTGVVIRGIGKLKCCCHGDKCRLMYILSRIMLTILALAALATLTFVITVCNTWIIISIESNMYQNDYNTTSGCPLEGPCITPLKCHYGNANECYIYGFSLFVIESLLAGIGVLIFYCVRKYCTEYDKLCQSMQEKYPSKGVEHTE